MKEKINSPFQIIIFILALACIIIIREGFLSGNHVYLVLSVTISLTSYVAYKIWKRHGKSNMY